MSAISDILDDHYPLLVSNLNVPNLIPYLKKKQLLTNDEEERLHVGHDNTRQDAARRLVTVLKTKGSSLATVHLFLSALKHSMVDDPHLGHEEIIAKLEESLRDFKPKHSIEIESRKEEGKNIEDLRCKIIEDSQEITALFATLALNTYRLLQERQVPVKDVCVALAFLGGNEHTSITAADLSPSSDLAELFTNLHKYSSWFNYFTIQYLATNFGGNQGMILMNTYEEELRSKVLHRFAHQCPEFALTRELPDHYQELTVKLEHDYMLYTAHDISRLRNTMGRLLKIKPSTFILKSVEEGCVLLTWAVPTSSSSSIISQVKEHAAELEGHRVLSVKTGSVEIIIRKGNDHFNAQLESSCPVSAATPTIRNDLAVLKRLSNNAAELGILQAYSGVPQARHYSLNQGDDKEGSMKASMTHNLPKSASFSGITSSKNKYLKKVAKWFGKLLHFTGKEAEASAAAALPTEDAEVDAPISPLSPTSCSQTPVFSEPLVPTLSSEPLVPTLSSEPLDPMLSSESLFPAPSTEPQLPTNLTIQTTPNDSVEDSINSHLGSFSSIETCASRLSKKTNVTSGYNSLERTTHGAVGFPRRAYSVSVKM